MKRWEYKVVGYGNSYPPAEIEKILNELGEKGWELVNFITHESGCFRLVLKREVLEPVKEQPE